MTLKQFMTRGMEKRGADFQFNVGNTPGPFVTFNKDKDYVTNLDQTALSVYGPHLFNGVGKDYWDAVSDYDKQRLIAEASGLLQEVVPKVLSGDTQLLNQLDKSKAVKDLFRMSGISGDKKPSEFVTEFMSDMTKDSGMMKFMLGASKNNPGLFKAFAHKYILQSMMKKMGLDPSKVYDYAPGLKDYDMNQHLPGMAAAFGIPFGIGALMGKPGWGLLIGLLGAGGYGYYKYNQMAGVDHPFSAPPSSQYLAEPAAEAPVTEPAPAPEAPSGPGAPASKGISSGGGGSPASTPVASNEDIAAQEQHKLGLDALDSEIDPSSAPVAQPSAPVVEKKNSTTPSYPARQPIKIDTSKPVPEWVNPEETIPAPSVQNVNIPRIPPVTPAPIGFDYLEQLQPKPMGKPSAGLPSVEEWRKEHPTRTTENVVRVKPRRTPSSGPKKDIVIEVPPHQETKEQTGPGFVPRNGLAVPPFFF